MTNEDEWVKEQKRALPSMEEFTNLKNNMRTAAQVAAILGSLSDVRSGNNLKEDVNILGVTPNYLEVRSLNVAVGRFLTEADELHHAPACFIGADIAKKFFSSVDPVGKTIRAGTHSYQVVGVAEVIGTTLGQSRDNFMLIPLGTYVKEWGTQRDSLLLFVQAQHAEMMEASQDEARMLLRASRHLSWNAPDNFGMIGSDSIMALWKNLTQSRSEEHTSELQSRPHLVCRLLLEKKKIRQRRQGRLLLLGTRLELRENTRANPHD